MNVIYSQQSNLLNTDDGMGIALGNFDGLHIGHMKLIKTVISISKRKNIKSMVYTFENHPENVIAGQLITPVLTSNATKISILKQLNLDYLYLQEFNDEVMKMIPEDFVKKILVDKFNVKLVVVGFNYHFGYKGLGNISLLKDFGKKYGFDVYVLEPVTIDGYVVSSSKIRKFLHNGDVVQASKYLGRNYSIVGKVVKGKSVGRTIGYPTINMYIDSKIMIPSEGVYVTYTDINDKMYGSLTNVGCNPTFKNEKLHIETHIININRDLYNCHIKIGFIKKIRDEKKFDNVNELMNQLNEDKKYTNKYFSKTGIYNVSCVC